ncbi:asparagine synthase-related protein, partial [Pseudomonadota bacterium]
MDTALQSKLEQVREQFSGYESVAVAFSGGVDSALVTKLAHEVLGDNAIAFTGISEVYAKKDVETAKKIARQIGTRHKLFDSKELSIQAYRENPANRCYHCKSNLYDRIWEDSVIMGANRKGLA